MSGRKILLFLLAVYGLLGLVCLAFPAEGVSVAGKKLVFATPGDLKETLFGAETAPALSPEELLLQRQAAIREAEQQRFESFFRDNPARLYFPDGDISLFDPFFEALDGARDKQIRILHYGDSQIEEDRITGTIRAGLQKRFGGGGPGLLPFGNPYYTQSFSQTSTASLRKTMIFGEGARRSDSRYGIMGQCARMDTSVFTTVSPSKNNDSPSRHFSRLTLLAGNVNGSVNLKCEGRTYRLDPVNNASGVGRIVVELPDSSSRARFSTWGSADIYGFQLDCTDGVCVDNIPMRSCSGTIFTRISQAQLKEYAEKDNVRLIILQFGGNSMPYRKTGKAISEYKQSLEKQIRHLHSVAPDASILFIGPSDMSTNIRGKMQTYPHLPMMVDSLKAAANNAGAAYWDMYGAMGGEGSMAEWVKARPQLAGSDYVHFTPRGAEAIGNMFFDTLMLYYDWYRLRKYGSTE